MNRICLECGERIDDPELEYCPECGYNHLVPLEEIIDVYLDFKHNKNELIDND